MNYQKICVALGAGNVSSLGALLENYSREDLAVGTAEGYDQFVRYRRSLTGGFYIKSVWAAYRNHLLALGFELSDIRSPFIGNPAGIYLNGDVIKVDTFRHIYHAIEMRNYLRGCASPLVVEIGGGDGTQAYQTIRLANEKPVKYVIFDIPEVAVMSSYYLLSAFPGKNICLYGDRDAEDLVRGHFDIAVLPHFAITQLRPQSVELFYNSCSFSEMDAVSSAEYLRIVESCCRKYFAHINHDVTFEYRYPDGSTSTNIIGSRLVPDPRHFRRVFKKPRVFNLPEDRLFPAFEYLYERLALGDDG